MGYTDAQKSIAVELIERYGGLTNDAIDTVRDTLSAPQLSKSTIYGWVLKSQKSNSEPNSELVLNRKREKRPAPYIDPVVVQARASQALDDMFEQVARAYLERALDTDVVKDTRGKDAVTTAAIAVDKMRLLRDLPTEIIEVLPTVQALVIRLQERGLDVTTVLNRMLVKLAEADVE